MAMILSNWRYVAQTLMLLLLAAAAFVVLNHPEYAGVSEKVNASLNSIDNPQVRGQMNVPLVLVNIMPTGLIGLFCAAMFAGFVSTHDTTCTQWAHIHYRMVYV